MSITGRRPSARTEALVSVLVWDVGLPLGAYFASRLLGASGGTSLFVAAAVAGVRMTVVAVRQRRFDGVSAAMAAMFAASLVVAGVAHDPRVLLAAKSAHVTVIALALLVSSALGRPVAFAVAKRFGADSDEEARRWDELYARVPAFRRTYVVMTVVWSAALLTEAAVRVALVYSLPLDLAAGLSPVLLVATLVAVTGWSRWYGARRERSAQRLLQTGAGVAVAAPTSA